MYWLLTVVMLFLADRIPVSAGRKLGVGFSRLALRVRKKDRQVAMANLARAFPELDIDQRECLLEEAAVALGQNLFDTLAANRLLASGKTVIAEELSSPGAPSVGDVLCELASEGRGVFILTGHLGCWELLGGWLAGTLKARGRSGLGVVTGTVHNPAVDRLLQGRRLRLGMEVLPREAGAGPLVRYLKSGGIVAVLQDQYTSVQNLDVPFFGEPAPTPVGLARLALRYGIPVVPVTIARDPGTGCHRVISGRPLEFVPEGMSDEDVEAFLKLCNRELEQFIRRNPAEWVWFHNRWNSKRH